MITFKSKTKILREKEKKIHSNVTRQRQREKKRLTKSETAYYKDIKRERKKVR